MEESLFLQYVKKFFQGIVVRTVQKLNDRKDGLTYMFRTLLSKRFSPTLTWQTLSSKNTAIAADIVSLDSSLPLKKRDKVSSYKGDIPKLGMKLKLNERQMQDFIFLQQSGRNEDALIRGLFEDAQKVVVGVWERLEYITHQALSTGVALVDSNINEGTGVRVNYGHPDDQKFGVIKPWTDSSSKPLDDITRIKREARIKGDTPRVIFMDEETFELFRNNSQVKELNASVLGMVITSGNLPTPTREALISQMNSEYKMQLVIIDRYVSFEKNGVVTSVKAWEDNKVSFLPSLNVGSLVYGSTVEELHPVDGVQYAKTDDFILVSKYRKNDPLEEYTSSQAFVFPVIDEIEQIYILDVSESDVDSQTEGDANLSYNGTNYTRVSVIASLNLASKRANAVAENTDAELQDKINALSDNQIVTFEANIVASV